ncbi:uncharacterized protein PAN0_005d2752 [Moesziomyces antarcticus]|uniref:Uncharacterized protein n=2 Tax=Pseudozyma antarctica TaxID=84753 RepID=A0A5C3FKR9_PSEA2|nr:uncharacterized protein PAN0_005d2752 [Moesziomyces antarcticus]GAK64538.1 conserved hypothetical protein [Moesziomyces antarcticus]SPO44954.1 uncharacterized protein PSANT_02640 [Moesziomyces antarcticus]
MIYEVAAAVEHILSLIAHVERPSPVPTEALAGFASTLKDALETRCQRCWHAAEPERGSAQRSIAWQLHPAGEGADIDLLRAFASVLAAKAEEGEIVHPHQPNVLSLALDWLPTAFTLWIDPGCVAIRRGAGPGASSASLDFDLLKPSFAESGLNLIWGHFVAQPADRTAPQLTLSTAPRPIPILKPAARILAPRQRYPVLSHHQRAPSSSSSISSISEGLVRSASLSSAHTVATDATSVNGADSESDACPSLCSPASSLVSSQSTPASDSEHDSVHDTTLGDSTQRFAGVRLFGDDAADDDDDAGDTTIHAGPLLGLSVSKPLQSSTPVKCNYTTHDNGNVGVLGGGVRLGGAAPAPRHRQHSNSKSISHLQGGLHNQLLPPYMPRAQMHGAPNYSAPMRTVPLPPMPMSMPMAPHGFQHQHPAMQPQPMWSGGGGMQLPTPYGFRSQPMVAPRFAPAAAALDGDEQDDEDKGGRRRMRSRGRRSRGRGAGRAARRQAAALRALELGRTDEAEYDELELGSATSRCSTPATASSYTASSYSSAASSPHKGALSHRCSRTELRQPKPHMQMDVFGMQLHTGLQRLAQQV